MSKIPEPVYQIKEISSTAETLTWQGLGNIGTQLGNGFVVLWQYHAVFTGQIQNGAIYWLTDEYPVAEDEHIVRIRAFNQNQEYHFWRTGERLIGRLRTDEDKEGENAVIDTQMVLRSVVANPLKKVSADMTEGTLVVLTRNYIDHDPKNQQAGYVDSRFVNFELFNV